MREIDKVRLFLVPTLAERSPVGHIGRTALMKYMYFLQAVCGIQLGYTFSLYSYGPFDSDVLADLSSAEALSLVSVTPVQFSGGYGYQIRPGSAAADAKKQIGGFLTEHKDDLDLLFEVFGAFNSAEMELASTIVYVDREYSDSGQVCSTAEIAAKVKEVKPHFSEQKIDQFVDGLLRKGVLTSVRANA